MVKIRSYKDLEVWKEAMQLAKQAYSLSGNFPQHERYALTAQLHRAVISVPANIAEGHGSSHRPVFLNQLSVAKGSLMEVETLLLLAVDLGYVEPVQFQPIDVRIQRIGKMIHFLIRALKSSTKLRPPSPQPPAPSPQ